MKQGAARYSGEMRRRFKTLSRGGTWQGTTWAPLSEATKRSRRGPESARRPKRRRRGGAKSTTRGGGRKFAVLRDTGFLFGALSIGDPGNKLKEISAGFRFGFSDAESHPDSPGISIAELAQIHHNGEGTNLPQRTLLDFPSRQWVNNFHRDLGRAFIREIRG